MNDTDGVTGIVLAGGMSRRLGRDKAVETIAGQALISRVLDSLAHVAQELVVVVNNSEREEELPLPDSVVTAVDIYPDTGSLGGIFTGLSASSNQWGFRCRLRHAVLEPRTFGTSPIFPCCPRPRRTRHRSSPGAHTRGVFQGVPARHRDTP